jgi:hypothetical protein
MLDERVTLGLIERYEVSRVFGCVQREHLHTLLACALLDKIQQGRSDAGPLVRGPNRELPEAGDISAVVKRRTVRVLDILQRDRSDDPIGVKSENGFTSAHTQPRRSRVLMWRENSQTLRRERPIGFVQHAGNEVDVILRLNVAIRDLAPELIGLAQTVLTVAVCIFVKFVQSRSG